MPDSFWLVLLLLLPVAVWVGYRIGRKSSKNQTSPDSSRYFKGINYLLNEQPDKAIDVFIEQIQVDNELVETHLALGNLYRRQGEVDRAIRIHQNLIARPNLDDGLRRHSLKELSQDYLSAGLYDRAESILIELKQNEAFREYALQSLISVYQQLKDWPQAIDVAIELDCSGDATQAEALSHFYCELAEESLAETKAKDALHHLKNALKYSTNGLRPNLLLSQLYMQDGAYKKAQKIFQLLFNHHLTFFSEFVVNMEQCYQELNQQKQYVALLEQGMKSTDGNSVTPYYIAVVMPDMDKAEIEKILQQKLAEHTSSTSLAELLRFYAQHSDDLHKVRFQSILQSITEMRAQTESYLCNNCGYASHNLLWQCPSCKLWGTMHSQQNTTTNQSEFI